MRNRFFMQLYLIALLSFWGFFSNVYAAHDGRFGSGMQRLDQGRDRGDYWVQGKTRDFVANLAELAVYTMNVGRPVMNSANKPVVHDDCEQTIFICGGAGDFAASNLAKYITIARKANNSVLFNLPAIAAVARRAVYDNFGAANMALNVAHIATVLDSICLGNSATLDSACAGTFIGFPHDIANTLTSACDFARNDKFLDSAGAIDVAAEKVYQARKPLLSKVLHKKSYLPV